MRVDRKMVRAGFDIASVTTLGAVLLGWMPHIASVLTVVWTLIRMWETDTVQDFVDRIRDRA